MAACSARAARSSSRASSASASGVNASWFLVLFLFIYLLPGTRSRRQLARRDTTAFVVAVVGRGAVLRLDPAARARATRSPRGARASRSPGIDLFLFGGVMKMSRDTDSPGAEFRVAAAGPLVTLADRGRSAGWPRSLLAGAGPAGRRRAPDRRPGRATSRSSSLVSLLVGYQPAAAACFNLVPAFPLDGGRIARAVAWKLTGDRGKATRFAARARPGLRGAADRLRRSTRLLGGDALAGCGRSVLGWLLGSAARAARSPRAPSPSSSRASRSPT